MGITRLTAIEIFTNPNDLRFSVVREKGRGKGGKYAIFITRGPGHNLKSLLSSQPFAETVDEAVRDIGEILEFIRQSATKDLERPDGGLAQFLNPGGQPIDQSRVLNEGLIARILVELRAHQFADTHQMAAARH